MRNQCDSSAGFSPINTPANLDLDWAYCATKLPGEVAEGDRLKAQIQRLYARWESLEAMKVASV